MRLWTCKIDQIQAAIHIICIDEVVSCSLTLTPLRNIQLSRRHIRLSMYYDLTVYNDAIIPRQQLSIDFKQGCITIGNAEKIVMALRI